MALFDSILFRVFCTSFFVLLKKGKASPWPRYTHPDHDNKIFVLTRMDDSGASFEHKPLFSAVEIHVASLDSLKAWKATKKECTLLCSPGLTAERLAHNYDVVLKEGDKWQVNALLMEAYLANKPGDGGVLGFTAHPFNLVALKKIRSKGIKLFPLGTCTAVQEKDYEKIVQKCKAIVVWYKKVAYQVQPFKPMLNFEKPDTGSLCPFFWVKTTETLENVNMSCSWVDFKGLQIPILQNEEAVEQHQILLKADAIVPQLPPAKRAKTG